MIPVLPSEVHERYDGYRLSQPAFHAHEHRPILDIHNLQRRRPGDVQGNAVDISIGLAEGASISG
jgi:hypothetical protein